MTDQTNTPAPLFEVEELVWVGAAAPSAEALVGTYEVLGAPERYEAWLRLLDQRLQFLGAADTIKEAQQVCQADYEKRIRSALVAPVDLRTAMERFKVTEGFLSAEVDCFIERFTAKAPAVTPTGVEPILYERLLEAGREACADLRREGCRPRCRNNVIAALEEITTEIDAHRTSCTGGRCVGTDSGDEAGNDRPAGGE